MYEVVIIIILISLNGLLAMSEIAFVSAKRYKLETLSQRGNDSAKKALLLLNEPEKFLSAVQIGITLVGILAGAFGGYTMAEDLAPVIAGIEYLQPYAIQISFAVIVAAITYLSLVIGELVPKSIALNNPESITLLMAKPMFFISKVFAPFIIILSISTKLLLFIFRIKKSKESQISEDELKSLLELGKLHGTFEKEESEMIKKIFSFNDKKVTEIMVPRIEVEWIDIEMTNEEIFNFISTHYFSKYVVCENNIDNFLGILDAKEFLINYHKNSLFDLKSIINKSLVVPDSIYSIELFEKFRSHKTNIALVVDEYGGTEGLITLHDLTENIVGEIPERFDKPEQKILKRQDNTYLADGSIEISRISEILSVEFKAKDYTTLGGFLMKRLGKIPEEGDIINYDKYKFEVVDMYDKRVDKVLIEKMNNS